jgi:DNA polymerase-3 subunit alpha/error-prone DNA polymerase
MHSTVSCPELCKQARALGYTTIGLTDINNLYGLWDFLTSCTTYKIRPIIGAEIRLGHQRIFCLVKNKQAYHNLCRLLTARHCDETFSLASITADRLQGLVLLTDDIALLKQWHRQELDVGAAIINKPNQHNSTLYKLARHLNMPAVAVSDVFFLHQHCMKTHDLLRAIACNTSLSRLPQKEKATAENYLAPLHEYTNRFQIWPEVISATHEIAERCIFQGPDFGLVLPPFKKATKKEADSLLRQTAFAGARERYGTPLPDKVRARLEHELQIIAAMGFSSYFLVVRDIVRPVARTCGRGSGAASLVAYCLRITNVCPLKHDLYFERFLNPGRKDAPDIDIDFAWDERDGVLQSVFAQYGCRSAMVCNHVRLQPRMAIREMAKVYGLPSLAINKITKRLSGFSHGQKRLNVKKNLLAQLQEMPRLQNCSFAHPWPEILYHTEQIIGTPRNLSVHPGGVIITPDPVTDYVPVEYAAKGVPIIQWDKDSTEKAGLVKIDLLGNRSLGVIRDAVAEVQKNGVCFTENQWQPEDDQVTRKLVQTGQTMGCFYIESPAMRLLQKKAGRGDFEHLVIHSSIIRPAANEFIREYLRRLHGGNWHPLHPLIADTLQKTYGIMVYQEDVSRVAMQIGFSPAEADRLRKIISKKDKQQQLMDYQTLFHAAAKTKGIDKEVTQKIWQMMMSFDGYSFCKPHSASYARVSFQAAYLKAHFPAEFMAAVLSNQGGYYSPFAYLSESRRMGLQILPPDINHSKIRWSGKQRQLRVGLMAIRQLSTDTAQRIIRERQRKKIGSLLEFLQRIQPADDEARALIHAGALDGLEQQNTQRTEMLYQLAHWQQTRSLAVGQLFPPRIIPPALPPDTPLECLRNEYRTLGFICHTHPISLFALHRKRLSTTLARDISNFAGQQKKIRFLGWPIAGKIVSTRSGQPMEFLTFEDETDQVECTFFPQTYQRCCHLLHAQSPLLLDGIVEQDFGVSTLTVSHVRRL